MILGSPGTPVNKLIRSKSTSDARTLTKEELVVHLGESAQSDLHKLRLSYEPPLPPVLRGAFTIREGALSGAAGNEEDIKQLFPHTFGQPLYEIVTNSGNPVTVGQKMRIGVVLSGGPAPGGHNVIAGLFDFIKSRNTESSLVGFLSGPKGVIKGNCIELNDDTIFPHRNQGGFHLLGSGRDKIETPVELAAAKKVCDEQELDGLVVIGGDDSNTNAAVLAEYFKASGSNTKVIGIPKTIDGDLRNEFIEISFGFDTATKVYSELIANLATDATSAKKSYHFVRLMGRDASHITVECALQTHPNLVLVSEEIHSLKRSLVDCVNDIVQLIVERAKIGKNYGIVLIPEGLIQFLDDMSQLIHDINDLLAAGAVADNIAEKMNPDVAALFKFLPSDIRAQLLLDRDPHGNVQISKIDTEKLLCSLTEKELAKKKIDGTYTGSFNGICHFLGYEGRCSLPSVFDCNYTNALGHTAGALLEAGKTGLIACIQNLTQPVLYWRPRGIPLTSLMNVERRHGKNKPVIKKHIIQPETSASLRALLSKRDGWRLNDMYRNPGSIQHYGPVADILNFTVQLG